MAIMFLIIIDREVLLNGPHSLLKGYYVSGTKDHNSVMFSPILVNDVKQYQQFTDCMLIIDDYEEWNQNDFDLLTKWCSI